MTTLICWVGIDQRSTSSIYIASDSRVSVQTDSGLLCWDTAQKVFCSSRFPDIYGYCGDTLFAVSLLAQFIGRIDSGGEVGDEAAPEDRAEALRRCVERGLHDYPFGLTAGTAVLMASRVGRSNASEMHCRVLSLDVDRRCTVERMPIPEHERGSDIVAARGSGEVVVGRHLDAWRTSDIERTSRGVFSALVDAIRSGEDPLTGGAPQLARLYRDFGAQHVGVILAGKKYFCGTEFAGPPENVEWRDELFHVCDGVTLKRQDRARRFARPPQVQQ